MFWYVIRTSISLDNTCASVPPSGFSTYSTDRLAGCKISWLASRCAAWTTASLRSCMCSWPVWDPSGQNACLAISDACSVSFREACKGGCRSCVRTCCSVMQGERWYCAGCAWYRRKGKQHKFGMAQCYRGVRRHWHVVYWGGLVGCYADTA
eukprot:1823344-Rhodomonas_salina.4